MISPRNSSQIKDNNVRTLLYAIKQNGPIAKRDLQHLTGLSWGAVSSLTGELQESGYVVLCGKQITSVGRKPAELDINGNDFYLVGIDLNTSALSGVVTDLKGRIVREWTRLFARLDYDCVLETLFSLLDEILLQEFPGKTFMGIGLAVQGFVDVEKGISVYLPRVRHWKNVPLKTMIEERYGYYTNLMHDPDCLMIAERTFGAVCLGLSQNAILLRLDGGIGMSIMSNGQLHMGANGKSGEFGHVSVRKDGPVCTCGNKGCLEELASGDGLVRRFVEQVNQGRKTIVDISTLNTEGYRALAVAAQKGDALCIELFQQMGEYLGFALSGLMNVLDPELVVLYGELANYRTLFFGALFEQMNAHLYTGIAPKVIFSEQGKDAAAQGAALVVANHVIDTIEITAEPEQLAKEKEKAGRKINKTKK